MNLNFKGYYEKQRIGDEENSHAITKHNSVHHTEAYYILENKSDVKKTFSNEDIYGKQQRFMYK